MIHMNMLILYASTSGNTELMADAIADHLNLQGHDVVIKSFDFDRIDVEDIPKYDAIFVGTHTWDDGELPYEVEDFYEEIEDVDITGKCFGVFGSADSFYDTYGLAVDLMADQLKNLGAVVFPERLKVDLTPNDADIIRCQQFAESVCDMVVDGKNALESERERVY